MFKFWGGFIYTVPILTVCLSLASRVEAIPITNQSVDSLDLPDRLNPQTDNRQEKTVNYFDPITDTNPSFISQTNEIGQLQDIKPTDWSYQALKNLIERYGCISGFPDRTYRGEQTVSRYEFVAGLNNCLNNIEKIIAGSGDFPPADLDNISRLIQEYQSELAILKGKTDGSQARLIDLEATQFSITSKLRGEAIFGLGSIFSNSKKNNTVFGSRLRLELATSFTGEDLLFTRLSDPNFPGFAQETGTFQGNLAFAEVAENLRLDALHYSFSLGDRFDFILGAAGLEADDIAPTISLLDGDGGSGAISAFGTRSPLYYPPGDAGLGISYRPWDLLQITAGYLADPANEATSGSGLFDGSNSALGQITVAPVKSLSLAATYVHSYNQSDTGTGTDRANLRSLTEELFGESASTVSDSYGLELSWAISDRIVVGGRGGLSKVSSLDTLERQVDLGTQDIWNWAATLAILDLGKEGSLAGIVVGSEPKVTNSTIDNVAEDDEQSLHLEAFYQYQVSDNIAITPGVIWITEPDRDINSNIEDAEDLVIGTVRTTFSF